MIRWHILTLRFIQIQIYITYLKSEFSLVGKTYALRHIVVGPIPTTRQGVGESPTPCSIFV